MRITHLAALVVLTIAPPLSAPAASDQPNATAFAHEIHGYVVRVQGDTLTLRERSGHVEEIDITAAKAAHLTGVLPVGRAVVAYGSRDAAGTFHATSIGHTSPTQREWSPDT